MSLNKALQQAVSLHKAGRVVEAEQAYRNVLRSVESHTDANYNLGLLLLQTGRIDMALPYFQRVNRSHSTGGNYWSGYVDCLLLLNKLAEARSVLERLTKKIAGSPEAQQCLMRLTAIESGMYPPALIEQEVRGMFNTKRFVELEMRTTPLLKQYPHWATGWKMLGITLQVQGKDGLSAMQQVAALLPDDVEARMNLGMVLHARGQFEDALTHFSRAVQLKPEMAEIHHQRGKTLQALGKIDEAIVCYRKTLKINPQHTDAYGSLGMLLQEQGLLDEALANFKRVAELRPDAAEAHNNLGLILQKKNELEQALISVKRALQLKLDYPEAHNNLGVILQKQGRLDAALASVQRALQLKPDYVYAHINCADILRGLGRFDEALTYDRQAVNLQPDFPQAYNNLLLAMQFSGAFSQTELFAEHLAYAQKFEVLPKKNCLPHTNIRDTEKRLKIGYVSADFRRHAVACFIEPVLVHHDLKNFEVYCYYNHSSCDQVTNALKARVKHWRNISVMNDEQVTKLVREDGIDILVDLSGHTAGNRLSVFIKKPAPVQVSWLGYGGSTGLKAIDYRISDKYIDPPGMSEQYHTEKLYRFSESCVQCFSPPQDSPIVGELPAKLRGFITFGSFNNLSKLSHETCETWAKVLLAVPNSQLMLKAAALADSAAQQRLIAFFARHGISEKRLILVSWDASYFEHLNRYNKIDICLDTLSYNGFTTSFDAMWMGVPVVSLAGNSYLSRMGVSMLSMLKLPELIAQSTEDFVAIASSLAGDLGRLAALRAGLRQRMLDSPLTDGKHFTLGLEHAYRKMWQAFAMNQ